MDETAEFLDLITHKLKYLDAKARVLVINNLDPLTAISDQLWQQRLSNFGNLLALDGQNLAKESEVLVFCLKHQSMADVLSKLPQIAELPGLNTCQAVVQQRVFVINDPVFTNSDPLNQLEILAEIIYPKFFAFGHEGKAWLKLSL